MPTAPYLRQAPEAETRLEYLLRKALLEPGHRPEFYRALLDAEIWIMVESSSPSPFVPAGSEISIVTWCRNDGVDVVPFFSSAQRAREADPSWNLCTKMTTRELFESMPGYELHLNPASEYGRQFSLRDVQALLEGSAPIEIGVEVTQDSRSLRIEAPTEHPKGLIEALRSLFRRTPAVCRAYVIRVTDADAEDKSKYVIAVEAKPWSDAIRRDTATVTWETYRGGEMIDVIPMDPTSEAWAIDVVRDLAPFYQRDTG